MIVEVTQRQTAVAVREERVRACACFMMERMADRTPDIRWRELSLVLTDDAIRELNREWFSRDTVTDVISFAYPEDGTGEVVVNVQQAREEGRLRESPDHELALYIAHGCDHLGGAEDDTPERKQIMLAREEAWVAEAGNHGLVEDLFA